MNKRYLKLLAGILVWVGTVTCLPSASFGKEGGESHGGGADLIRPTMAWYVSDKDDAVVRGCYQLSADFGVPVAKLEEFIALAFKQWSDYLSLKHVAYEGGYAMIARKLVLSATCAGTEDLKFYFGVEDETVRKAKAHYSKPFGFAELYDESYQQRWSRGFVWIAGPGQVEFNLPAWNVAQDALWGLILHEMGHVFGNGHVEGTVMTPRIAEYLTRDAAEDPRRHGYATLYSVIDAQVELLTCLDCDFSVVAASRFDPLDYPDGLSDWEYTFETFVGRKAEGTPLIRFERLRGTRGDGVLILADAKGELRFDVATINALETTPDNVPLFYTGGSSELRHQGAEFVAQIKDSAGAAHLVSLAYNENLQRVVIKPIGGGAFYPRPYFVSAEGR